MKSYKKIIMVSHTSGFSGGAELSMLDMCDEWRKLYGVEVTFVIRKPAGSLVKEIKKRNFDYKSLYYTHWLLTSEKPNMLKEKWTAQHNLLAVRSIQSLIKELKPDLVMTNTLVVPWGAVAASREGVDHIWIAREDLRSVDFSGSLIPYKKLYSDIEKLSSALIVNSEFMKSVFSKILKNTPMFILYPSFNSTYKDRVSKNVHVFDDNTDLKAVLVGTVKRSKGQLDAVKAVGELKRKNVRVHLCIVGEVVEESYRELLQQQINKDKTFDLIKFIGYTDSPHSIVEQADVGLMTSTREAFGRTTVEYMMASKPVIGVGSGGTTELITNGTNGYLYKAEDHLQLARVLRRYAEDKELLKNHSRFTKKSALKIQSKYTPAKVYKKMLKIEKTGLRSTKKSYVEEYLEIQQNSAVEGSIIDRVKLTLYDIYLKLF